jgi:3-dehydroquinate synthase
MTEKLIVDTGQNISEVFVGESLRNIDKYVKGRKVVIVTDKTVNSLYGSSLDNYNKIIIGEGESVKTLSTIEYIYEKLISFSADRNTLLIGVGGGVVTDITGFAASTFMRGIPYGFVSTTLLSQVDAGIGGKNGVNFNNIKNMIGTINQPEFVIEDTETLLTLPEQEIRSGLGELVKHSFLEGEKSVASLDEIFSGEKININHFVNDSRESLNTLIFDSLKVKAAIVSEDEKEHGVRRVLNLGHTLGHAVEIAENIPHGLAVIKGIIFSALFSVKKGYLDEKCAQRIITILNRITEDNEVKAQRSDLKKIILHDKKRENDSIYFVFLKGIGNPLIEKIKIEELLEALDDLCIGR